MIIFHFDIVFMPVHQFSLLLILLLFFSVWGEKKYPKWVAYLLYCLEMCADCKCDYTIPDLTHI